MEKEELQTVKEHYCEVFDKEQRLTPTLNEYALARLRDLHADENIRNAVGCMEAVIDRAKSISEKPKCSHFGEWAVIFAKKDRFFELLEEQLAVLRKEAPEKVVPPEPTPEERHRSALETAAWEAVKRLALPLSEFLQELRYRDAINAFLNDDEARIPELERMTVEQLRQQFGPKDEPEHEHIVEAEYEVQESDYL